MKNQKLRIKLIQCGMKQWELARLLNISESAMSKKLREELPEEEQERILEIIEKGVK